MAKEIAYEKYGAKKHTMLPATKRKQAKARKAEEKGTKAKKEDKSKQRETRVSSKAKATQGSSGDSQSSDKPASMATGTPRTASKQEYRDAQRGWHVRQGAEDDRGWRDLTKEEKAEKQADWAKRRADLDTDYPSSALPDTWTGTRGHSDAPTPGDSDVLTDPNDGRYQYQILANDKIKIVAAPDDTDFKGMILDDPTSKAYKAIMGVFKSGESPSAGTGGADPTDRVDSSGSGPGTSEPADDLSFSSRDVADRTWDQYYGDSLETTPPDGPYQDWSHLDPKGQVEMEPLTTTSDPTVIEAGEGEEPPPQSDPEPQYLSGDEGAAAHKKWAESHPSSEQVVPEDQPVAAPESAPDVVSSDTSALDDLADIRPEGLGSRALDDEAMPASATDAARMAQARELPRRLGESPPEDFDVGQYEHNLPPQSAAGAAGQPKYAGTTSDQEDNLRRLREMYKTEGVETAPNLGESPPAVDDTMDQHEYNLPPQSEQPDPMGRNQAVDLAWEKDLANRKSALDRHRGDLFDETGTPRAGQFPAGHEFRKPGDLLGADQPKSVLDEYRGDFFDASGAPRAGQFPSEHEFYSGDDPMGTKAAVDLAWDKDELLRLVRGKSDEQRAMVSGILKGKHGAELAAAIKRIRSIISRGES